MSIIRLFPFWGESFEQHHMGGTVTVRFINTVTEEQREKIKALVPGDVIPHNDDFSGRMMECKLYTEPSDYGREDITNDELFTLVNDQEIEEWLIKVHSFCPVQFACKNPLPGEASHEEKYSEWHIESVKIGKKFIEGLIQEKDILHQLPAEKEIFAYSFKNICFYLKLELSDLPEEIYHYIYPVQYILQLIEDNKIDKANHIFKSLIDDSYFKTQLRHFFIFYSFHEWQENTTKKNMQLSIMVLDYKQSRDILFDVFKIYPYLLKILDNIIRNAALDNNDKVLHIIQQEADNPKRFSNIAQAINAAATDFMARKDYRTAIKLFDLTLSVENEKGCKDLSLYCNALPALENNNNGFPVDKELNNKFLAKCLPFAPKNPVIYFNASCLYMEMKEMDKAFDCIKELKKYQFKEYDEVINLIKTQPLFEPLRKSNQYNNLFL